MEPEALCCPHARAWEKDMSQKNRIIQTYGLWFLDMLCIFLSYNIATQIRFAGTNDWGSKTLHYLVMIVFLLFCTVYSYFVDWNRDVLRRGLFREFLAVLKFNTIMLVISLVFVFFAGWSNILSRIVILHFAWINLVLMYAVHILFRRMMRNMLNNELYATKILIVTQRAMTDETIERLHSQLDASYQIVGSLSVDDLNESDLAGITEKMTQIAFDEVFINTPDYTPKQIAPMIDGFERMGVVCHYNLELPDGGGAASAPGTFGDYAVMTYTRFRSSYKRLLIKRVVDIVGAAVGLVITAVVTVFLAPAIRLDSPGPVFFSQIRVGKNGRRFRIYKFRSMYLDAEERKKELEQQNEVKGLMFKMEEDPRVTRVGRFIRKTSLDELPQFWNILKGDMSLVGTRPPTEEEFEHYDEHYRRRLSMTPGLTGMWQVSGRSNIEDFDEVVKLDLKYIDNWSLTLDFKILLQTVGVVLFHKGAK